MPGRGQGKKKKNESNINQNPWGGNKVIVHSNSQNKSQGQRKFEDACREINASVQHHISKHQDNDDIEDEDDEDIEEEDEILARVLSKYDENEQLGRTHQFLQDAFKKGALVCLICIENIKHNDQIWSCTECYTSFHISCIQKWAKDSLFLQADALEQKGVNVDKKSLKWCCPKCRCNYSQNVVPSNYYCFCGKKKNPSFDPWLIPHSCGNHCNKLLRPECGHSCLLLCHPGPCPPCPTTVRNRCHCGKQDPQIRRCSSKHWSCNAPCGRSLACGQHACEVPCHDGDCPSCPRKSKQKCLCGAAVQTRSCAQPTWQCDKVCGRQLSCGHHRCDVVCHEGQCGECPSSGVRNCPCGKSSHRLPCTTATPTCGDTCSKVLTCGIHHCAERCHKGACPSCLHFRLKPCRCGAKEKEMACSKDFTCEIKCKKIRDCGRHSCNKKCCIGECPFCENVCGKTLVCGSHKCESRCHPGPCYPCTLSFVITCRCKMTSITVPCGREKTTNPPKCNKLCKIPPDCHHTQRKSHKCHFGDCPRCNLTCSNTLSCGHTCPQPCHDCVPVKVVDQRKRAGPWERAAATYIEIQKKPCPPCLVPVPTKCRGEHENPMWPCSDLRSYSCGRPCGRNLSCGNHKCEYDCHVVEGAQNTEDAGQNCSNCERSCEMPKPEGCFHPCKSPCHPGQCPPCRETMKVKCHCTITLVYVKCVELRTSSGTKKENLLCCKNQCNKSISCGHWCQNLCHSGECSKSEDCKKRVAQRCPCKRIRKDFPCHLITSGAAQVNCDDTCLQIQEEKQKAQEEEKRKLEEERVRREKQLEELGRKTEGKKRRQRFRRDTVEHEPSLWERGKYYILSIFILILALIAYLCY